MRTEVQKIIDNHFKDTDRRFSVMNYNFEQITTVAKLLTWNITEEEVVKQNEESQKEMNKIYDFIINERDYVNSLKNLAVDVRSELDSLQTDLLLQRDLNNNLM